MRVFVTGGSGLIGRNVARRLADRGDQVVILSRRAAAKAAPGQSGDPRIEWVTDDPMVAGGWMRAVDGCDAVVNLAGQNIFGQRWNADVRRAIRDSRVFTTGNVVAAMASAKNPPRTLVQASAIGYYGPHGDEEIDESSPAGNDFMANVCSDWERAAEPAKAVGARLATARIGVVLAAGARMSVFSELAAIPKIPFGMYAPENGALGVLGPLFKWALGAAAPVGNGGKAFFPALGKQWMSWVHIDDVVNLILRALDDERVSGPMNAVAPQPVRNADFTKALKRVLFRPYFFWRAGLPIGPPDWVMKIILGEVADVVTKGARVLPREAQRLGHEFAFPEVAGALASIFGSRPRTTAARAPVSSR